MNNEPIFPENSPEKAQAISDKIALWWRDPENSELTQEDLTQLIQQLSGPPAVWSYLPEDEPYDSMEAWCEGELDCEPDSFLDKVASLVGEEAVSPLRDRRLSAIFRPLS
ncbi:hypothetical protein PCC7418_0493 [Halothece sp. PCC 7418]|uniref:hypothetical protein n=1 Tax=Halothece sp. (strain PCC 7418) TaxID=65093 RepID=UPI0002A062BC|nr:hypothetical protein [Halothece sp. PCC 7418]AFZ42722.1 hypothetical protein PCC7418_0493 [Halothece sp. PCC 7418]